MKQCTKCLIPKILDDFNKYFNKKTNQYKYEPFCKECAALKRKNIYNNNQEKYKKKARDHYEDNKEYYLNYTLENKDKLKKYAEEYRVEHKDEVKKYQANRYEENKNNIKKQIKEYKKNNKDKVKQCNATYYLENKDKVSKQNQAYHKERKLTDPLFKLRCNISSLICIYLKKNGYKKNSKTAHILGCTFEEFKKHLEKQFDSKMNWNNQGTYWELDHIKPISLATTEQELIELNHYTNFQPLYWEDNLNKSNKYHGNNTKTKT